MFPVIPINNTAADITPIFCKNISPSQEYIHRFQFGDLPYVFSRYKVSKPYNPHVYINIA